MPAATTFVASAVHHQHAFTSRNVGRPGYQGRFAIHLVIEVVVVGVAQ